MTSSKYLDGRMQRWTGQSRREARRADGPDAAGMRQKLDVDVANLSDRDENELEASFFLLNSGLKKESSFSSVQRIRK